MTEPPSATPITGVAAGVPFLAVPPSVSAPAPDGRRHAVPLIVAWHLTYPWPPEAMRVAERLDFVARADDIARVGKPSIRLIVGAEDDHEGFLEPARRLYSALTNRYGDSSRVDLVVIPGMGHALAKEPGLLPAPQTATAAVVDQHTIAWLRAHLPGCTT